MTRLSGDDRAKITEYLLLYGVLSLEYRFDRNLILHGGSSAIAADVGTRPVGGHSDPCASKVMRLYKLDQKNAWLALIRKVEYDLTSEQLVVLRARRLCWNATSANGGWVYQTQRIIESNFPSRRYLADRSGKTLGRIWGKIIDATAQAADKRGLI
jgi:hypothetical protein